MFTLVTSPNYGSKKKLTEMSVMVNPAKKILLGEQNSICKHDNLAWVMAGLFISHLFFILFP